MTRGEWIAKYSDRLRSLLTMEKAFADNLASRALSELVNSHKPGFPITEEDFLAECEQPDPAWFAEKNVFTNQLKDLLR